MDKDKWIVLYDSAPAGIVEGSTEELKQMTREIVKRRILYWVQEEPTYEGDSAEDIYTAAYGSRVYSTAFVGYEGENNDQETYITVSAYRMDDIPDTTIEKLITNK